MPGGGVCGNDGRRAGCSLGLGVLLGIRGTLGEGDGIRFGNLWPSLSKETPNDMTFQYSDTSYVSIGSGSSTTQLPLIVVQSRNQSKRCLNSAPAIIRPYTQRGALP